MYASLKRFQQKPTMMVGFTAVVLGYISFSQVYLIKWAAEYTVAHLHIK